MKHQIIAFLFCFGLLHSLAADEPLIPAALNAVLPKIHVGMTIREVEAALAPAYPKVKGQMGIWSGQTGYIDYKLDERHTLSVSSITRDGKEVVHGIRGVRHKFLTLITLITRLNPAHARIGPAF